MNDGSVLRRVNGFLVRVYPERPTPAVFDREPDISVHLYPRRYYVYWQPHPRTRSMKDLPG
jgi:hypothetical protein